MRFFSCSTHITITTRIKSFFNYAPTRISITPMAPIYLHVLAGGIRRIVRAVVSWASKACSYRTIGSQNTRYRKRKGRERKSISVNHHMVSTHVYSAGMEFELAHTKKSHTTHELERSIAVLLVCMALFPRGRRLRSGSSFIHHDQKSSVAGTPPRTEHSVSVDSPSRLHSNVGHCRWF